jgi:hypothetical protein
VCLCPCSATGIARQRYRRLPEVSCVDHSARDDTCREPARSLPMRFASIRWSASGRRCAAGYERIWRASALAHTTRPETSTSRKPTPAGAHLSRADARGSELFGRGRSRRTWREPFRSFQHPKCPLRFSEAVAAARRKQNVRAHLDDGENHDGRPLWCMPYTVCEDTKDLESVRFPLRLRLNRDVLSSASRTSHRARPARGQALRTRR